MLAAIVASVGAGPVGVLAAASAEAGRTAVEHIALLAGLGVQAVDLGVTIDTVDYAVQDSELLERIAGLRGVLLCGGNQIRLVETLLHRGEESAVLRAIARAHAQGAALIAASGAASALSGVMIAGGSSYEALRYGVSSDTGHRGLVIQEGIGLFGGGIVDQNLLAGNRLGRLLVACAEESERYGVGIFEDSAVIATAAGMRLEAAGKHGFLLAEIDPMALVLQSDSFIANGIRVTVLAPGRCRRPSDRRGRAGSTGGGGGRAPRRAHRGPRRRGPAGLPRPQAARAHDARARQRRRDGAARPRVSPRRERLSGCVQINAAHGERSALLSRRGRKSKSLDLPPSRQICTCELLTKGARLSRFYRRLSELAAGVRAACRRLRASDLSTERH